MMMSNGYEFCVAFCRVYCDEICDLLEGVRNNRGALATALEREDARFAGGDRSILADRSATEGWEALTSLIPEDVIDMLQTGDGFADLAAEYRRARIESAELLGSDYADDAAYHYREYHRTLGLTR